MANTLSPQETGDNEDAARALFSFVGGYTGYMTNLPSDTRLGDFSRILHADPEDDLSGLRLLASRMQYGMTEAAPGPQSVASAERFIEPVIARWWLQASRRADIVDGTLLLRPKPDHLGLAAFTIANSETGADFYEAYASASDNRAPLSREVVTDIARSIVNGYFSDRD